MSTGAADNVTAQMANTTLTEPTSTAEGQSVGAGGDKPVNAAQNEAVIQSAAEGRRLYIGNLAYATTEGELKDFFKDYLIESVSIPVNPRTTRPVGYAFVDVSTASEAERAIADLNKKNILDRPVSVQLARKPEEQAVDGENAGLAKRRNSGRGRGRGRGRGPRSGRTRAGEEGAEANGEAAAPAAANVQGQVETRSGTTQGLTTDKDAAGIAVDDKDATVRPRRQRGPPEDGVPSKTKIMVANLPYDLREDKLLELFKDFSPSSAKLALRPIPRFMIKKLQARNEPRKGRGFAFVTFPSEELQQKAIAEMNAKEVEGRELAVKVAIDSPGKEDEAMEAQVEAEVGKENGFPSTAEGSASTEAPVPAS